MIDTRIRQKLFVPTGAVQNPNCPARRRICGLLQHPRNAFRRSSCRLSTPSSSAAHQESVLRPPNIFSPPAPASPSQDGTKYGSPRQGVPSAPRYRHCRWTRPTADALPGQFAQIDKFYYLVLALGSGKGVGPFATVGLADVKLGFEEKVYAHFATAQAALPFLNPTGSLTFVSAVSAHAAVPGTAPGSARQMRRAAGPRSDSFSRTQATARERRLSRCDPYALVGCGSGRTEAGDVQRVCRQELRSPRGAARGGRQGDRLFNWRRLHHRSHTDLRWWIALHGVSRPIAQYEPPESRHLGAPCHVFDIRRHGVSMTASSRGLVR